MIAELSTEWTIEFLKSFWSFRNHLNDDGKHVVVLLMHLDKTLLIAMIIRIR